MIETNENNQPQQHSINNESQQQQVKQTQQQISSPNKKNTHPFSHIFGNITPREIETLYWAANGLSAKKTAEYLNMSVHTIHSYRKSVIRKLQANSITHAVYIACQRGFI